MTRQSATKKLVAAIALTIGLFGAVVGRVEAHVELTAAERAGTAPVHNPEAPVINVKLNPDRPHNSIIITWEAVHAHIFPEWDAPLDNPNVIPFEGYEIIVGNNPALLDKRLRFSSDFWPLCESHEGWVCGRVGRIVRAPVAPNYTSMHGWLQPNATYYVRVASTIKEHNLQDSHSVFNVELETGVDTATITTAAGPGTPTDPETPNPSGCSYKHRLTSVPAMTGGGYTSQILISSEESNATATIRAYQSNNGQQIDVLDSAGNAVSGSVPLSPAYSSKRFKLEGIQGWHTVIVEHPSERAMNRATVVMRLREPGGGISIVPMEGVSDCATAGTNTE